MFLICNKDTCIICGKELSIALRWHHHIATRNIYINIANQSIGLVGYPFYDWFFYNHIPVVPGSRLADGLETIWADLNKEATLNYTWNCLWLLHAWSDWQTQANNQCRQAWSPAERDRPGVWATVILHAVYIIIPLLFSIRLRNKDIIRIIQKSNLYGSKSSRYYINNTGPSSWNFKLYLG